jgi:hypothetical protein
VPSGEACGSCAGRRGELRQAGREYGTPAHCRNMPTDGRNKPAVHMIVAGLAMILAQFDSVAPSICGYARFVAM